MQNRHHVPRQNSLAALIRDLRLSLHADEPLLCDCDPSTSEHECE